MYALVDCNNFYVSCERVFRPDLAGKPVVVLSNNDGCIISRSDEAKALGIAMGAPEFKAREQLKANGVTVFSSNYPLYGDLSRRVMQTLRYYTPYVEEYSIDEAFLEFREKPGFDFQACGQHMKRRIAQWVGIPVCVGIAPTKTLAKIANKIARKFPDHTNGVYVIGTPEKRLKALRWTPIEAVWGVGHRMKKRLEAQGIHTALDFIHPVHEPWIRRNWGIVGLRMRQELEGTSVIGLEASEVKKSIAVTRSFPKKITDFDGLRERVSTFASVCAEKLRAQHCCCQTITVLLGTMESGAEHSRRYVQHSMTLPFATHSTLTITETALRLLEQLFQLHEGLRFYKAGVVVTQLIGEDRKQFHLFEDENPRHLALMQAMDRLNQKMGDRILRLGVQDRKTWNMKQEALSPRYTTRLDEILTVKC